MKTFRVNGLSFQIRAGAGLDVKTQRDLIALGKLRAEIARQRAKIGAMAQEGTDGEIIARPNMRPGGRQTLKAAVTSLQRKEARALQMRSDLKGVISDG